jgi:hypothetical protein
MSTHPVMAALLLTALLVTGCGADDGEPAVAIDSAASVTLTVSPSLAGPRIYYTEGAVQELRLLASDGSEMPPDGDSAQDSTTWSDLAQGDYALKAAIRPCDGNCGYLDPPTDQCEQHLSINRDTEVTVEFRYGHGCRIKLGS